MNRFKKELVKKGININPEMLPMDIKGRFGQPGHIFLDDIRVNTEKAEVTEYLNILTNKYRMLRNGELEMVWDEREEAF